MNNQQEQNYNQEQEQNNQGQNNQNYNQQSNNNFLSFLDKQDFFNNIWGTNFNRYNKLTIIMLIIGIFIFGLPLSIAGIFTGYKGYQEGGPKWTMYVSIACVILFLIFW